MALTWRQLLIIIRASIRLKRIRRPKNTPFRQQSMPAWKPMITAGYVIPTIFGIGAAFVPIGIGMILFSNSMHEKIFPYTDCTNAQNMMCKDVIKNTEVWQRNCTCNITFEIEEHWLGNVYMYYGLGNFYQNHRLYIRSRDDSQLLGNLNLDIKSTDHNCEPYLQCKTAKECCNEFRDGNCTNQLPIGTIILPCGSIANSMFSDVITLW